MLTAERHVFCGVTSVVTVQEFKAGKSPIMTATDVAARGLGMRSQTIPVASRLHLMRLQLACLALYFICEPQLLTVIKCAYFLSWAVYCLHDCTPCIAAPAQRCHRISAVRLSGLCTWLKSAKLYCEGIRILLLRFLYRICPESKSLHDACWIPACM